MLDSYQKLAVSHQFGPALVLAGPGSGKTSVLISHIKSLITEYSVMPDKILVVTFTKDAARQMQARFMSMGGRDFGFVTFGTLHSICYHILRSDTATRNLSLISPKLKLTILKRILSSLNVDLITNELIEQFAEDIERTSSNSANGISQFASGLPSEIIVSAAEQYRREKDRFGVIDFSDMIIYTRNRFMREKELLMRYQGRYSHVLVDEFQDLSESEFDIIRMIAAPENNIFAVGDDDQSIYGFRGSSPKIMLNFNDIYPDAKIYRLSRNYRSLQSIVSHAGMLISKNSLRYEKDICAMRTDNGSIRILSFADERAEATAITEMLINSEVKTAVLFRTHSQCETILKMMEKRNESYRYNGKSSSKRINDILDELISYMKIVLSLSAGNIKRDDLIRIINRPERCLPRSVFTEEAYSENAALSLFAANSEKHDILERMFIELKSVGRMQPYAAMNYIYNAIGYAALYPDDTDILLLIKNKMRDTPSIRSAIETLCEIRKNGKENKNKSGKATFLSFHGSKGLEFDRVIILDCIDGVTPSKRAADSASLEEERRLFYVAMTRAKDELILCYTKSYGNKEAYPSPFVREAGF